MAIVLGRGTVLYSRSEWGARPPKTTLPTVPTEGAVDHWLGPGINLTNHDACPAALRSIQNYHMDVKGWSDIAYNWAGCPHGYGYDLRGGNRNGANGTAYWNKHTYTFLWLVGAGDYFGAEVRDPMARAIRDLIDWSIFAGGANPALRRGHRDVRSTSCPGDAIHAISRTNWYPSPPPPPPPKENYVDIAATPTGKGYWLAADSGSVDAFGDANHYGDLTGTPLSKPIVGISPTPSGLGYHLVGADGGVFCYGDAKFFGSLGAHPLNAPVVDLTPTPTGKGYWIGAADGGVFTFGDAQFYGSGA